MRKKATTKRAPAKVYGEPSHVDDSHRAAWLAMKEGGATLDVFLDRHPHMKGVKWKRVRLHTATADEMRPRVVKGELVPAVPYGEACARIRRVRALWTKDDVRRDPSLAHVDTSHGKGKRPKRASNSKAAVARRRRSRAAAKVAREQKPKAPAKRSTKAPAKKAAKRSKAPAKRAAKKAAKRAAKKAAKR